MKRLYKISREIKEATEIKFEKFIGGEELLFESPIQALVYYPNLNGKRIIFEVTKDTEKAISIEEYIENNLLALDKNDLNILLATTPLKREFLNEYKDFLQKDMIEINKKLPLSI